MPNRMCGRILQLAVDIDADSAAVERDGDMMPNELLEVVTTVGLDRMQISCTVVMYRSG